MEEKKYYFEVSYSLFVGDEEEELMEQTEAGKPLVFYTGVGMMLEKFEQNVINLNEGDEFDFSIPCEEAYGEYEENGVIELPKAIFEVDGKVEESILFEGNVVPLRDSDGNRVDASVVKIGEETVTVDLNHPLAGEDLHFVGKVEKKREATEEEIKDAFSCGHSCGDGDDDCGCGCGCGHCH